MKNLFKLIGVVLAAAFLLVTVSCGEDDGILKKGGTIIVTNELGENFSAYVIIVKGFSDLDSLADKFESEGTLINAGEKETFKFDEDGTYTVTAMAVPPTKVIIPQPVLLSLGNTKKITLQ